MGEERDGSPGHSVLTSMLLSNYSIYPYSILASVLLVDIAESFGASVGVVSQIMTASSILGFLSALSLGALSVRYSARRLLLAGLLVLSLSCLGTGFSSSLGVLFIVYPLNGLAANIVFPMLASLVAEYYPPERRARVMGWVGSSGGLSYMLGAQVAAYLASVGGWRLAFLGYAALVPLAAFTLAAARLPASETRRGAASLRDGFEAIRGSRSALASLASVMLMGASTQSIYVYSFSYLREVHGVSLGRMSLIYSVASLAFLLGSLYCGSFAERLGVKRVMVSALAVAIATQAAYAYLPLWGCAAALVVGHFFFSLQYSAANTLVLEQVPAYRGSMMSMASALGFLGYASGTALAGVLLASSGWKYFSVTYSLLGVTALALYFFLVDEAAPHG
ncbi:MFS transporter [Candidatus Bathyarchaeota archaeon]|nr:MFS transporter [Candidatus Bathyarchaeota archaeon]